MKLLSMRMTRGPHPTHPFPHEVRVLSEMIGLATTWPLEAALLQVQKHVERQNSLSEIWALDLSLVGVSDVHDVSVGALKRSGVLIVEQLEV